MNWLHSIEYPGATGLVEILILAAVFYFLVKFFRGTRGAAILTGITILFTVLIVITQFTNLMVLNSLLQALMPVLALSLVVTDADCDRLVKAVEGYITRRRELLV